MFIYSLQVYGAIFSDDNQWYRCQVRAIFGADKVKVHFIDYGNNQETTMKELVEIPADLAAVKPIAQKVMLHQANYNKEKMKEVRIMNKHYHFLIYFASRMLEFVVT